jgi:hypothetical protein
MGWMISARTFTLKAIIEMWIVKKKIAGAK